jgi:redox-regulated HSP33 family molecular chaperone
MEIEMKQTFATVAATMGVALALAAGLAAQQAESITGTWNMGLQGDHVIPTALVLKQDGTAVTGTIAMPTQNIGQRTEVTLAGEIVDRVLKLSGDVEKAKEPTTIVIEGKLTDEGMLEGTLKMDAHGSAHNLPWTAERLRERK